MSAAHPKSGRVIDARGLEPPEPFVLTMDALDRLPRGEKLLLQLYREPLPLYKALASNGFSHETERLPDGTVEVLIWHTETP